MQIIKKMGGFLHENYDSDSVRSANLILAELTGRGRGSERLSSRIINSPFPHVIIIINFSHPQMPD